MFHEIFVPRKFRAIRYVCICVLYMCIECVCCICVLSVCVVYVCMCWVCKFIHTRIEGKQEFLRPPHLPTPPSPILFTRQAKVPAWIFHVCFFVCASAPIMCAIITSCTLLPCYFTLVDLTAALSTGVATMSSLAQLWVWDIEEQRQRRPEADREWKHQKWAATCDAYRAANQLRMAARRALEWIRMFEGPAVSFRYEISDLLASVINLQNMLPH